MILPKLNTVTVTVMISITVLPLFSGQPVHSVAYNGINGVIYNNTILATGCFTARELWRLSKSEC